MKKPIVTIHLIDNGFPMCCFHGAPSNKWPYGHIAIQKDKYNAAWRALPEGDVDEICPRCEDIHLNPPDLGVLPLVASEGRTCDRCGIELVPTWPSVYCTPLCAQLDA